MTVSQMKEFGNKLLNVVNTIAKGEETPLEFLLTQTRLSILCWSPGPKRWSLGATENHTVVRWHIVSLRETPELLQHAAVPCRSFLDVRYVVQQAHM